MIPKYQPYTTALIFQSTKIKWDYMCNGIKLLFVGRLDTPKDPLTLLQAATNVIKETPDASFTLCGDGEKYGECEKFVFDNKLERNVFLLGWQHDVIKYYKTHHIFVASSIYESFGLMFVDAGYYKLPVVATDVEGVPEVVENGVTGLLSPPRRPELLAQNILCLIGNEEQRLVMGENGYRRVTSLFTSNQMLEKYNKLYRGEQ